MKAVVLSLLLCCAAEATITEVQQASCAGSTCTAPTINPTGSGNILVAMFAILGAGSVTSVTDDAGNTWTEAPNCAALSGTAADVDCWYVVGSKPGATTITGTLNGGSARAIEFYEFSVSPGCFAYYDTSNAANNNSALLIQHGVALTLNGTPGTDDVIVQGIFVNGGISLVPINLGYLELPVTSNRTAAYLLGATSGAAPNWTLLSVTGNSVAVNAIAFVEACSVSVSASPTPVTLNSGQQQQFTASVLGILNRTVTWSVTSGPGSVDPNTGIYTAPANIPAAQTVTVTATASDGVTTGSATVSLAAGNQVVDTYQLSELFGVTWPDQPIEFRYKGVLPLPSPLRMVGPLGVEVPSQWVSSCSDANATNGCVVVRSNLPANTPANNPYTWTLVAGVPPTAAQVNPVQMNTVGNNIEITNGLAGVRILTQAANPSPFNLAPIQGILLPGGTTWTGAGTLPNSLYSAPSPHGVETVGDPLSTRMSTAISYTVTVVDQGPLKTVVQARYTFNRPQYSFGPTVISTPGTGYYTLIVTMYANSKSVLIDEESDMQFAYFLPVYSQLQPDSARWRGHDSVDAGNNPDPACGYESPLTVSNATNTTPVVMTTSAPNPNIGGANLTNGQVVAITGVLGNTAANGTFYAKTISATQFSLYTDANLTLPVAGNGNYTGGGTVKPAYRGAFLQGVRDALQDLTYTANRPASYACFTSGNSLAYRKILSNYPPHAAGWYEELYNSQAGPTAPVVGFYVGRASKQVYSGTGPSLPGVYSSNNHFITNAQDAGIEVDNLLRGPDASTPCPVSLPCDAVVHRNWGIFVSTQADLLPNLAFHQPIASEQNMLTGINLSRLYTYQLVYPDPPGGWQPLYLPPATVARLQSQVQNGTNVCGTPACYATLLKGSEGSPAGTALLGLWEAATPAAAQAAVAAALQTATNAATGLENTLVNGDNRFDQNLAYYQLGLSTSPQTVVLNAILALSTSNPTYVSPTQKALAKAELALFGSIFWDDDWFPVDNNSGESAGNANQIEQYLQYRTQSALAAPSQPLLSQQLLTAQGYSSTDFASYFSPTGAAAGSTHYQSAFFEPLILNYMNLLTPGLSMTDPKWTAYANWELSIQTPPEPRFGNIRKGYSNGDGNTESDVRTGMLGTALNPVNPGLASNLMWAWQQSNSASTLTEDSQFVTTLATIDPTICNGACPAPQLGSINIPGYHSVERYNFGTPNETALWFIDGGFYSTSGHRHYDDGQVSIYAHSAPLAIDWNANLYNPETPGRFMHNSIVYDSELPHVWSADNAGLSDVVSLMTGPSNAPVEPIVTEFAAFANSTTSTAKFVSSDGTVWLRTVRTMNFNPSYPVIYVKDTFSGLSAGAGKTLTWNLMADSTKQVTTPAGPVTPIARLNVLPSGCGGTEAQTPTALPSNGNILSLAKGLSQFSFTGATWNKHATQGINWDLFTVTPNSTQQFMIGNWGHTCHASREMGEFQAANSTPGNVVTFSEVQDILRVHDTGPFETIILPYRKGEKPTRVVSQTPSCGPNTALPSISIGQTPEAYCFNDSMSMYIGAKSRTLTVYDATTWAISGITLSGGPQEVVTQGSEMIWTIAGVESGTRTVALPGTWYPKPATGVTHTGNTFSYTYPGGQQTAPVTITFSQVP